MSVLDTNTLLLLHCDDFNDSCDNYTVTNNGVTISSEGKFGNCFSINQSYITFNKAIELNCNTGFTIDFWINPSQFDNSYQYHLSSGLNFISYDKNKVYCSMCGINKDAFYVNEPLALNEFTHIAIVGENNVIKIFINGVLKASKDAINETQVFDTNNKFFIYQSGSTSHNPVCKIDEFRISNIARWQTDFEVPTREYGTSIIEKLSNESSLIDINNRNELLAGELFNLKTRLKNNLVEKGVECSDNDKMSILINKINTLPLTEAMSGNKCVIEEIIESTSSTTSSSYQLVRSYSPVKLSGSYRVKIVYYASVTSVICGGKVEVVRNGRIVNSNEGTATNSREPVLYLDIDNVKKGDKLNIYYNRAGTVGSCYTKSHKITCDIKVGGVIL